MKVVTYYRVSTQKQGNSGLGLEAQKAAVDAYCHGRCNVVAEYTEIETGKRADRPVLADAIRHAKITGSRLIVAKLDRLARNLHFITSLQQSGVQFTAADMPDANELTIHIMAAVAQAEAQAISTRTKEALQAAKARGVRLGNPMGAKAFGDAQGQSRAVEALKAKADEKARDIAPIIEHIRAEGHVSLRAIAAELNKRGVETPRGKEWQANSVRQLLARLSI